MENGPWVWTGEWGTGGIYVPWACAVPANPSDAPKTTTATVRAFRMVSANVFMVPIKRRIGPRPRRHRGGPVAESASTADLAAPLVRQVFCQLFKHRYGIRVSVAERRRLTHLDENCRLARQHQAPNKAIRA